MKRLWIIISGLIFLSGCSYQNMSKNKILGSEDSNAKKQRSSSEILAVIAEQEAKLMDVPIPLDARPLVSYFDESDEKGCSLGYTSDTSQEEVAFFYTQEMERLGWLQTVACETVESILIFEKPGRFCIVSLRPASRFTGSKRLTILLFTGQKK